MSNKANINAFVSTAVKKRRRKIKRNTNKFSNLLLATFILVALLSKVAHAHAQEKSTTAGVKPSALSCWLAIGNIYLSSSMHSHVLVRVCILVQRGRGRTDLRKLILLLLLIGGIELNPGPPGRPVQRQPHKKCPLCNGPGRTNAIWVQCKDCEKESHATCLKLSPIEKNRLRKAGYICYQCSLPASLSDSFLSIEPPPAINESFESAHMNENAANKNKPRLLCFNARSLKNRKTGADIAALIQAHSPDIIGINETWLTNDIKDHEFIPRSYMVFRKDRPEKKKGKKKKTKKTKIEEEAAEAVCCWPFARTSSLNAFLILTLPKAHAQKLSG